jgi:hypothetical protein
MPMGATLALRQKDKKFTRKIDGAKASVKCPPWAFRSPPGYLGWVQPAFMPGPGGMAVVLV